jgi:hypothetical protein
VTGRCAGIRAVVAVQVRCQVRFTAVDLIGIAVAVAGIADGNAEAAWTGICPIYILAVSTASTAAVIAAVSVCAIGIAWRGTAPPIALAVGACAVSGLAVVAGGVAPSTGVIGNAAFVIKGRAVRKERPSARHTAAGGIRKGCPTAYIGQVRAVRYAWRNYALSVGARVSADRARSAAQSSRAAVRPRAALVSIICAALWRAG